MSFEPELCGVSGRFVKMDYPDWERNSRNAVVFPFHGYGLHQFRELLPEYCAAGCRLPGFLLWSL